MTPPFSPSVAGVPQGALTSTGVGSDNGEGRTNGSIGRWGVPRAFGPAVAFTVFRRDTPNGIVNDAVAP